LRGGARHTQRGDAERNIKNARKALETEILQKARLSADDENHLTERLMALSRSVEELARFSFAPV
jgi:hypothetical protein